MAFNINHLTPVVFGAGVAQETGKHLKEHGITTVFCVYDKGIKAAGIVDEIISTIQAEGINIVEFDGVLADPPDTIVDQAGELARKEGVDGVLGIGGGSSLDTAKAVNVLLGNPGSISNYYGRGVPQNPGKPLFAIPTTAGTGSEVTAVAVISNIKKGKKQGVVGKNCIPTLAIVDPSLTLGLSPQITAGTGMDTFSHAVEAFTSVRNNPMSDLLALEAMSLVATYLPIAVKDGSNAEARAKMSFASTIAGMSFNDAPPHLGHAIAHTMGAKFHVPHGTACGLATPGVIEYVSDIMPDRVRSIGKAIGLVLKDTLSNEETGIIVANAVRDLNKEIDLPALNRLAIEESGLNSIAADTPADVCAFNVPKEITPKDVLKLLQKEYARTGG